MVCLAQAIGLGDLPQDRLTQRAIEPVRSIRANLVPRRTMQGRIIRGNGGPVESVWQETGARAGCLACDEY
jgi:hypothetical protein